MLQIAKTLGAVLREAAVPSSRSAANWEASQVQRLLERHSTKKHGLEPLDRVRLAVLASAWAIANPYQGKGVAMLGEITGEQALRQIRDRMLESEEGRTILKDRLPVFPKLVSSPQFREGTLGKLLEHCVPEERARVEFVDDPELAFVMRRYREAHDVVHALTGFPVTVAGEIAVKWYESAATKLPMTTLSSVFGLARAEVNSSKVLAEWIPWAATAGLKGRFYLSVQYTNYLECDVDEFRNKVMNWPPLPTSLKDEAMLKDHYRQAIRQAFREGRDPVALREEARQKFGEFAITTENEN